MSLPEVWPRVDGLRSLELGTPGVMRSRLNDLVLRGAKTATAGLLDDYVRESEPVEHVGEQLALLDDVGRRLATVEITDVDLRRFVDVPWDFARAEGEGDVDLAAWRSGHRHFWSTTGARVSDDTQIVCLRLRVTDRTSEPASATEWQDKQRSE